MSSDFLTWENFTDESSFKFPIFFSNKIIRINFLLEPEHQEKEMEIKQQFEIDFCSTRALRFSRMVRCERDSLLFSLRIFLFIFTSQYESIFLIHFAHGWKLFISSSLIQIGTDRIGLNLLSIAFFSEQTKNSGIFEIFKTNQHYFVITFIIIIISPSVLVLTEWNCFILP